MTLRFHNHEAASIAVAKLRSEGYFAEILASSWSWWHF